MPTFQGFGDSETFTRVPDSFFRKLLNEIDSLDELKVTLYLLWRIEQMEGAFHTLCRSEMLADEGFMAGSSATELDSGLEKAVRRGSLLKVENDSGGFYLLNSPRGRAAAEELKKGDWRLAARPASAPPPARPNIFKLYEENIGPLTPLLADALRDAEQTYPPDWVAEAFAEAVGRNKRNWKYIEAILRRWKEEGHAQEQNRRDAKETRGRDVSRKVDDFLKR
ncbi:MAG: DnaD domain protein [Chloroflexota bacterium]